MNNLTVRGDNGITYSGTVHAADQAIADVFSFDVVHGSILDFRRPGAVILASSVAQHIFGTVEASGTTLTVYALNDTIESQVAAVYEDFPKNSHAEFKIFITFEGATVEALGFSNVKSGVYGRTVNVDMTDLQARVKSKPGSSELVYSSEFNVESAGYSLGAIVLFRYLWIDG